MTPSSPIFVMLFIIIIIITTTTLSLPPASSMTATESNPNPKPKRWPDQFHSILVMNVSGKLELSDLWYDWTNGRNLMILQYQLGRLLYDLEWNNGTSFYYTLDGECSSAQFDVGIVTPNWFDSATYLGQRYVDGFLCNVWEKADFLTYYEDLLTKRPVLWVFFNGNEAHVMTFEVGATLEDAKWQVPSYCFDQETPATSITKLDAQEAHLGGGLVHDIVEQYMEDRAKTIDTTVHRSLFDFSSMRALL